MKTFATCLTVVLMTSAAVSRAQTSLSQRPGPSAGYGVPTQEYGFGPPCAGLIHHSTTAAEGYNRGVAAMIQARAQYNLLTSLAKLNALEAQRMQIENHQQWVESKNALRKAYREERDAQLAARRKQPDGASQEKTTEAKRSQASDSSAAVTSLQWPVALTEPKYAGYRKLAEGIAAQRLNGKVVEAAERKHLKDVSREVLKKLDRDNPTDRDLAQRFVENLVDGKPASATPLAQN